MTQSEAEKYRKHLAEKEAEQMAIAAIEESDDAKWRAIDEQTDAEYEKVLQYLERAANDFKSSTPPVNCQLNRQSKFTAIFTFKLTNTSLHLVKTKDHHGRVGGIKIIDKDGDEETYRLYPREDGLQWVADNQAGIGPIGDSESFASQLIEVCY